MALKKFATEIGAVVAIAFSATRHLADMHFRHCGGDE